MKEIAKKWREKLAGFDPWKNPDGATFDVKTANRMCKLIQKTFKHVKGELARKPFILEKWQQKAVGHIFGWKNNDGTRRFRRVFVYIPRKNGKTTFGAVLILIMLYFDGELGAELYSAGADSAQAGLIFEQAQGMVEQNSDLLTNTKIYTSYKSMAVPTLNNTYKVLSGEDDNKDGLNLHAYIVDEVHAQKKRKLIDVLETGTGARRQPLGIYLTTADFKRESVCNEMLDYAEKVRDGIIKDPEFLPIIFDASLDDDWTSEKVWKKANPNYGVSLKKSYMKAQCRRAKAQPSYENTFKRLHLNIQTEQESRWLKMEQWGTCINPEIQIEDLKGAKCYGGLDLSQTTDITGFVLFFPEYCSCLCYFWVPQTQVEKRIEYEAWERDSYIEATSGNTIDYSFIRKKINNLSDEYQIIDIGYDEYNSSQIAIELSEQDGLELVKFRQGFLSMNAPSKELERLVLNQRLNHFNNPVLNWMASNVSIKEDASTNIKPIKPSRNSSKKIDGIVALIMAIGRSMAEELETESVYNERGLIIL